MAEVRLAASSITVSSPKSSLLTSELGASGTTESFTPSFSGKEIVNRSYRIIVVVIFLATGP